MNFIKITLLFLIFSACSSKSVAYNDAFIETCKPMLPKFVDRAKQTIENSRKISKNFENFAKYGRATLSPGLSPFNVSCKLSWTETDGGVICAGLCRVNDLEGQNIEIHVEDAKWRAKYGAKDSDLIDVTKILFSSGL